MFDELWGRRDHVTLGNVVVPTLSIRDAFMHSCHHAAKDDWKWLRSLVDVHRLARESQVWNDADTLAVTVLDTLAVVQACLGLPQSVPNTVVGRLSYVSARRERRALRAQAGDVTPSNSFPGLLTLAAVGRRLRSSHRLDDVLSTVSAALISYDTLSEIEDTRAPSAVIKAIGLRFGHARRRFGEWRRPAA